MRVRWSLNQSGFFTSEFLMRARQWRRGRKGGGGETRRKTETRRKIVNREFEQDNEVRRRRRTCQFLPSAHYLAHTELDVTGGCSTCLPMCRCLCILTLILALTQKKQRDMKLYPVFVLLPSFGTKFTAKFSKIFANFSLWTKAEERIRRDMDSRRFRQH
jgi:hypothetical protein